MASGCAHVVRGDCDDLKDRNIFLDVAHPGREGLRGMPHHRLISFTAGTLGFREHQGALCASRAFSLTTTLGAGGGGGI